MYIDQTGRWCFAEHTKNDQEGRLWKAALSAFVAEAMEKQQAKMIMQMADMEHVNKLDFDVMEMGGG